VEFIQICTTENRGKLGTENAYILTIRHWFLSLSLQSYTKIHF